MLVVADASVLVHALTNFDDEGDRIRAWLVNLSHGQHVEILRNSTRLEFLGALCRLCEDGDLPAELAEQAIRDYVAIPARHHDITQPMAVRIWELRGTLGSHDAASVALVERLQSEGGGASAVLATTDSRFAGLPSLSIRVEVFTDS